MSDIAGVNPTALSDACAGKRKLALGVGRRNVLAAAAGSALLMGAGCANEPIVSASQRLDAQPPEAAPLAKLASDAHRIAWVFSSGGPRGFVHVGVIKGLAALGLAPDFIVGASAGALVGTLCAAGLGSDRLEQLALTLQPWHFLRWNTGGPEWLNGNGLPGFVNSLLDGKLLQDLAVPMACVATKLHSGEVVAFTRGDAGLAVQAASAIAGRLAPVSIGGIRYVDADDQQPLPVRVARALGATRVLAVDASAHEDRAPELARRYREADLRKRARTLPDACLADLLIHPDTSYWTGWTRAYRERLIAQGEAAALAQAGRLAALHAARHTQPTFNEIAPDCGHVARGVT